MSSKNTSTDIWIAGAFAAFTVDLLVFPIDTLKTRLQSSDYKKLYVNEAKNTLNKPALFRGLYQGLFSVVIATLPSSGAFFTTYEGTKSFLTNHNPNGLIPLPVVHATASGLGECVSCFILTPAEVIKQNAQMVSKASVTETGMGATMQTLQRFKSNPFALWRGYGALTSRNLPFTALQFPMFEKFKQLFKASRAASVGERKPKDIPLWESGIVTASAAGIAAAISSVITTPIDILKTRIMLDAAKSFANQETGSKVVQAVKEGKVADALGSVSGRDTSSTSKSRPQKQSSIAIAKDIIKDQGWRGLWRGGALRAVFSLLGGGLYLGVYESGRVYLERGRMGDDD